MVQSCTVIWTTSTKRVEGPMADETSVLKITAGGIPIFEAEIFRKISTLTLSQNLLVLIKRKACEGK